LLDARILFFVSQVSNSPGRFVVLPSQNNNDGCTNSRTYIECGNSRPNQKLKSVAAHHHHFASNLMWKQLLAYNQKCSLLKISQSSTQSANFDIIQSAIKTVNAKKNPDHY
jgi:hypothetical protein